jgi:hypothetical protein
MSFPRLRQLWSEFRDPLPGHRFRTHYRRRNQNRSLDGKLFRRLVALAGALICLIIAIPLMILPGPAIAFFALTGLLLAGESRFVAALFDYLELLGRSWIRRWQRRKQPRHVNPA